MENWFCTVALHRGIMIDFHLTTTPLWCYFYAIKIWFATVNLFRALVYLLQHSTDICLLYHVIIWIEIVHDGTKTINKETNGWEGFHLIAFEDTSLWGSSSKKVRYNIKFKQYFTSLRYLKLKSYSILNKHWIWIDIIELISLEMRKNS